MRVRAVMALALASACACANAAAATPAWTTYHHDGLRTGFDPDSTSPVTPTETWQTPALDGDIYAEPLVYGSRVYVATENDSVYALDSATGNVVWHVKVGNPVPEHSTAGCGDIGDVGITGTPVIDPATGRIYAVATTWDGSNVSSIKHILVGLNLADGASGFAPLTVDAPASNPKQQLQRPGLALTAGRIVIGYGGHAGDCGNYHGWLVSAPESGSGALSAYEVDAGGLEGAIWGSGNAPAVDTQGNVWVATGNGMAGSGTADQESVLRLSPAMKLLGSWKPANWQALDTGDVDLGSSEPLPLPGGLFFQIGKEGVGYLLSSAPSELFEAPVCPGMAFGGGVYYAGIIYVACHGGLRALALNAAAHTFSPDSNFTPSGQPLGPPIIAGDAVWSTDWVGGTLYALDRSTGATRFSQGLGTFMHFVTPSAAGGQLFVANGGQVTAFAIARPPSSGPPPPPPAPSISRVTLRRHPLRLKFALSETATVKVVLSRVLTGHRAHGRCQAHAKRGRRCQYSVRKLSRTFRGAPGNNEFKLRPGKLGRGRYQLSVVASAGGASSKRHLVRFRL